MLTFRHLSLSLRAAIAAPWLLIVAAIALGSTPAFRQVLIDAANKPTTDVSLSSSHWTGTLDDARLSGNIPRFGPGGTLATGDLDVTGALFVEDAAYLPYGLSVSQIYSNGGDPSIDLSNPTTGYLRDDGIPALAWTYDRVIIQGDLETSLARIGSDGTASFADGLFGIGANGGCFANNMSVAGGAFTVNSDGSFGANGQGYFNADVVFQSGVSIAGGLSVDQGIVCYGPCDFYAPISLYAPIFANRVDVSSNINAYGNIYLSGSLYDANGNQVLDSYGNLVAYGGLYTSGNLTAAADLFAYGSLTAYGNLYANHDLYADGAINTSKGLAAWGHDALTAQPSAIANATNASDVITRVNAILAVLRNSGQIAQ